MVLPSSALLSTRGVRCPIAPHYQPQCPSPLCRMWMASFLRLRICRLRRPQVRGRIEEHACMAAASTSSTRRQTVPHFGRSDCARRLPPLSRSSSSSQRRNAELSCSAATSLQGAPRSRRGELCEEAANNNGQRRNVEDAIDIKVCSKVCWAMPDCLRKRQCARVNAGVSVSQHRLLRYSDASGGVSLVTLSPKKPPIETTVDCPTDESVALRRTLATQ